jgi:hypothetical protein
MLDALSLSFLLFGAALGVIVGRAWADARRRAERARRDLATPSYDSLVRGRVAVRGRFYLERSRVFVVESELLEGEVRKGMLLAVPYFESDDVLTAARVDGVEELELPPGDTRLLLGCTSEREAVMWHELIHAGQTLDVLEYDPR